MSEELKSKFEKEAQDIIKSLLDDSFAVKHIPVDDENWQDGYTNGYITGRLKTVADEWVSAADRLPEVGQDVLCGDIESDIVATGWYMSPEGFFADRTMNVTHWQPLPSPPNQ